MAARSRYLASIKEDPPPPPPGGPGFSNERDYLRPVSSHSHRSYPHSHHEHGGSSSHSQSSHPTTNDSHSHNSHNLSHGHTRHHHNPTHNLDHHLERSNHSHTNTSLDDSALSALSNPPPPPPGPPPPQASRMRYKSNSGRSLGDRTSTTNGDGDGGTTEYSYGDNYSIPTQLHEGLSGDTGTNTYTSGHTGHTGLGGKEEEEDRLAEGFSGDTSLDHSKSIDEKSLEMDHIEGLDMPMDEEDDKDHDHGGNHEAGDTMDPTEPQMESYESRVGRKYGTSASTSYESSKDRTMDRSAYGTSVQEPSEGMEYGDRPVSRGKRERENSRYEEEESVPSSSTPKFHSKTSTGTSTGSSGRNYERPYSASMKKSDALSHDGSKESVASRRRRKAQQAALHDASQPSTHDQERPSTSHSKSNPNPADSRSGSSLSRRNQEEDQTNRDPPLVLYDSDDVSEGSQDDDENSAMTGSSKKKKKALERVKNLIRIGNKIQKKSPTRASPARGRSGNFSDDKKRPHDRSKSPATRRNKFFGSSSNQTPSDHVEESIQRSAEITVNRAKLVNDAQKINASLQQLREGSSTSVSEVKSVGSNSYKRPKSSKSARSGMERSAGAGFGGDEDVHAEPVFEREYTEKPTSPYTKRPSVSVSVTTDEDEEHPDDVSEMTNPTYTEAGHKGDNGHGTISREFTKSTMSGSRMMERAITSESNESSLDPSESATPLATTHAAPTSRGLDALHERDDDGFMASSQRGTTPTAKGTSTSNDDGFGSNAWEPTPNEGFFPSKNDFEESMSGKDTKDPFEDPFFPDAENKQDAKYASESSVRQFSESTYASDPPPTEHLDKVEDNVSYYSQQSKPSLDIAEIEKDDTISFDNDDDIVGEKMDLRKENEDEDMRQLASSPVKSIEEDMNLNVPSSLERPSSAEEVVRKEDWKSIDQRSITSTSTRGSRSRRQMQYHTSKKKAYSYDNEEGSLYSQQRSSHGSHGERFKTSSRAGRSTGVYQNDRRDSKQNHSMRSRYTSDAHSTGNKSSTQVQNQRSTAYDERHHASSSFAAKLTGATSPHEIFRDSTRTLPVSNTRSEPVENNEEEVSDLKFPTQNDAKIGLTLTTSPSPPPVKKEIVPALSPKGLRRILQPGHSSPKYHGRHNLAYSHAKSSDGVVPTVNRVTRFKPVASTTKKAPTTYKTPESPQSTYSRTSNRAASLIESRKSPGNHSTAGRTTLSQRSSTRASNNSRHIESSGSSVVSSTSSALVTSNHSRREKFKQPSFQRNRHQPSDTDTIASEIEDPIQRAGFRLLSAAAVPIQTEMRRYLGIKAAEDRRWAIVVAQAYFRRWRCELYRYRLLYCATRIQAAFRGWLLRDTLADKHYCASQIQKIARGYLATMQVYESLYNITVVQSIARRNAAIKEAEDRRRGILKIQSFWRGFVVRQCIGYEAYQATRIQSLWRGYTAQLSYQFYIVDIIIVQSIVRRRAAMRLREAKIHKRLSDAATVIQKHWRSYDCTINYLHTIADVLIVQSVARRWIAKNYVESHRYELQYTNATKIQKIVRGWTARIRWRRFKAAVNIQRTWRGFQCYIDYIFAVADIVIAQRIVRQFLAKKKVEAMRRQKESDRINNAAVMIQKTWRGYQAHMDMLFTLVHIIIAQSVVRRRLAINKVKPQIIQHRAATKIQRVWNAYMAEKNYHVYIAVKQIQAFRRGVLARREYKRQRAARLIQAHIRGFFAFRALKEYYAARKIQAWSRCYTTMRGYIYYVNARKIQAVWRGFAGRRELDEEVWVRNYAATLIQKMWRGFYQFSNYTIVHFENKAAIKIQSAWRGFWQYSHFVIMSYEAARIQALVRGYQQRTLLAKQQVAAVKIQAVIRGFMTKKYVQMERLLDAMRYSAQVSLSSRIASTKIQRFWRIHMIYKKQKRAALVIERFFIWVRNEVENEIHRREVLKASKRKKQRKQRQAADDNLLESVWNSALDNSANPASSDRKKERSSSRARGATMNPEAKHRRRSKSRPSKKTPSSRDHVESSPFEKKTKRKERFSYYTPESPNRPTDAIPIDNTDVDSEVSGITTPSVLHSPLGHRSSGKKISARPKKKQDPLDDVDESLEAAWAESTKAKRSSRRRSSSKKPSKSSSKENSSTNVRVKQRRDILNRA